MKITGIVGQSACLLALSLLPVCVSHGQGLGGMLGKAKDKMKSTAESSTHADHSTQGGELPGPPSEKTLSSQQLYARALLADQTPLRADEGSGTSRTFNHRKLVQLYHMPIKFTWDDAAVNEISRNQFLLWDEIDDVIQTF